MHIGKGCPGTGRVVRPGDGSGKTGCVGFEILH